MSYGEIEHMPHLTWRDMPMRDRDEAEIVQREAEDDAIRDARRDAEIDRKVSR